MDSMNGKCLCGAVTFTAHGVDTNAHSCHCSMCRTWSGGPAVSVAVGSVSFRGEENIARFASSAWAERGFSKQCGTNLFYRLKEPNHYIMSSGPFEDQTKFTLAGEIYIDEKPPTYSLAGDHSRLTGAQFLASIGQAPPRQVNAGATKLRSMPAMSDRHNKAAGPTRSLGNQA